MLNGYKPWPEEDLRRYRRHWEGLTIAEMVFRTVRRAPDALAIVSGDERVSYRQLRARTERLAARLLEAGIRTQDRVVMQLPNSVEMIYAYLALTRIGAIPVMALRTHRHAEVRHFINASGAAAYLIPDRFHGFDYRDMAAALQPDCPTLRTVLVAGAPGDRQLALGPMLDVHADPAQVAATLAGVRVDPADVATMLLSGGTTSVSKLIPRSHDDYVLNARLCGQVAGFASDTVHMVILPLGHNYNLASPGILGVFYYGGTVVLAPDGDADTVFALVERERVQVIAAAVPLIANWLNSGAARRYDLSSLRVIQNGGARLAPELRRRLRDELGCLPQEIYGTAEGLINMTRLDDPDELILESSGAPVCEDDEIRVLDEHGNDVPDGEAGELVTRGPYTIRGYYDAPEADRKAFTADGFYRMGDIVRRRGRHVFAEGRANDLINRGGEKISCEEIENLILQHPKVLQTALVAMPDELFGEKACAVVRTRPGETLAFDELIAFLRTKQIASFKLPERLEVMAELPVSPVGKILKRVLREQIAAKLADERAAGACSAAS
ncbi:MAG TPA: AMP-binding protein [Rhodocyclaceae bacterium]|nr:AMP-binding protein [Rhodocyclaceae bacterium]